VTTVCNEQKRRSTGTSRYLLQRGDKIPIENSTLQPFKLLHVHVTLPHTIGLLCILQ